MLETKDAGRWFKIYFNVLAISIFVESLQHGMSNQNYIPSFDDVDRIGQLNWCDLVIESLLSSKLAWEKNMSGRFTGPILFLAVLYVDRVVLIHRTIPRAFPAFIGWSYRLLYLRELSDIKQGQFGFVFLHPQPLRCKCTPTSLS